MMRLIQNFLVFYYQQQIIPKIKQRKSKSHIQKEIETIFSIFEQCEERKWQKITNRETIKQFFLFISPKLFHVYQPNNKPYL